MYVFGISPSPQRFGFSTRLATLQLAWLIVSGFALISSLSYLVGCHYSRRSEQQNIVPQEYKLEEGTLYAGPPYEQQGLKLPAIPTIALAPNYKITASRLIRPTATVDMNKILPLTPSRLELAAEQQDNSREEAINKTLALLEGREASPSCPSLSWLSWPSMPVYPNKPVPATDFPFGQTDPGIGVPEAGVAAGRSDMWSQERDLGMGTNGLTQWEGEVEARTAA